MALKIWDSTEWKMASQIKVWDGTTWQNGSQANVHVWTGTAWQKVHPGVELDATIGYSVFVTDPTDAGSGGNAQARVNIFANGKIQTFESTSISGTVRTSSADWLLTGTNSDYDIYVANFGGDNLESGSGPVDGTRTRLSSDVEYSLFINSNGTKSSSFDIIICANNSATGTTIQTAPVFLQVDVGGL
jgi:hypothetical protein